ncbi:MAG: ATP-binding cassette domain-containing protein [Alistipes sp.]|jgi:ABC-type lipopolysaccharide export system ATPase subunit|nr:ATP-binding cassette domain-containing protein [Alistipes sp.]
MNNEHLALHSTLEADGIRVSFGERIVIRSIYVKVSTGRVTGLVGRNGCGKSTLMRVIHGSLGVSEKSIRIDGCSVQHAYQHGVMFTPQHGFIPSSRSVRGVVRDHDLDFDRLAACFPIFGSHMRAPVSTLSGGERRLLETFMVLTSPHARFCLLDEPFSQISPLHIEVIMRLISEEKSRKGIMVADHMYRQILDICDDIYTITNGTTRPLRSPDKLNRPDSSDSPISPLEELRRLGYLP